MRASRFVQLAGTGRAGRGAHFAATLTLQPAAMWHPSASTRAGNRPGRARSRSRKMRRNVLIALGFAALVWGVLAIVLGSPSLKLAGSGSGSSATRRLAAVPAGDARPQRRAAGHAPSTSRPRPETDTANPRHADQLPRRAGRADPRRLGRRRAQRRHAGTPARPTRRATARASCPTTPFDAGEQRDRARDDRSRRAAGRSLLLPRRHALLDGATVRSSPTRRRRPADYQSFDTLPGVQAPVLTVTAPDRDPAAGDIFTTNGPGPGQYGPLIYTPAGAARLVRPARRRRNAPRTSTCRPTKASAT